MRTTRVVLVLAVLAATVLIMAPGQAKKNEVCILAGSVTLNGPANLLTTAYGTGSFAPSSLLRCTGPVAGQGSNGGSYFYFCQHNLATPSTNPACHNSSYNGPTNQLEPLYDNFNAKSPAKIIAHAKGSATFVGFSKGVSCTLAFEGHSLGTAAELVIKSFVCSNGFKGTAVNRALALAVPVPTGVSGCPNGPGNLKVCFKSLEFIGAIVLQG